MTKRRQILITTLFTAFVLWTAPVWSSALTKETAAEQVQKDTGGKVLSVDEKKDADQTLYKVKVLHDDGMIKVYQLDAATGKTVN